MIRAAALITVCLGLSACGLTAPRGGPGFASLESPGLLDTDREMSLSIGPTLLHFAASHVDDDPEVKALVRSLDGVRIRIYEIDGDAARVARNLDRMQAHLEDDGWEPVMLIRSAEERTQLLLKASPRRVYGLTLLVSDGESEAVVINLIGDIRPEFFSDVMVALDIDEGGAQEVEVAMMTPCSAASSDRPSASRSSRPAAHPVSRTSPGCGSGEKSSPSKSPTPRTSSNSG